MNRLFRLLLALVVASSGLLGGCSRISSIIPKKPVSPFTLDYAVDESNIDFFVAGDDFDTAISGGPFYAGTQPLPTQGTAEFETARAAKVAEINAIAARLVTDCDTAKSALASLRSEYTTYLNAVYQEEKGLDDIAIETLNTAVLLATKQVIAEQQYLSLVSQEATQSFAVAMRDYLALTKASELAALMLEDADTLASYSAVMVTGLAESKSEKVKSATAAYDTTMTALLPATLKALEPVAQGLADIDLAMRQLASADYYFTLEALGYMKAESVKLDEVVATLAPREGLTQEDVDGIKAFYAAFKEFNTSMEQHAASMDTSGLVEVKRVPFPDFGPEKAYAAGAYEPGVNHDAGLQLLTDTPAVTPPKKGWLASGWDGIKSGFGKVKTGIGVSVDTIGLGVRNITSVGAGIYYGNSAKDIVDNIMTNTKEMADNYQKGLSGSSTFTTAGEYIEGVEAGAGEAAGGATEWTFEKILGKGKISGTAGWAVNGVTKISVGLFTGLAKGIYKVADKKSSTEDVVIGFIEIGLGAVGGSKVLIKASQLPGLLKGGAVGAQAFSKFVKGLVAGAANASERKAVSKTIANLLIKKGVTPDKAKALITASLKAEINAAVGQLIKNSRGAMIKKIRDLLASGAKGGITNFKETAKGSLQELLKKSFPKTLSGYIEAATTVVGATAKDWVDNLVAGGVTDALLVGLIKTSLAIPPDPEQVSGTWSGSIIITDVKIPESESKRAEDAQCEQMFKQAEGKMNAMTLTIRLNAAGNGTAKLSGGTGSGSGKATYSNGSIKMVIKSEGTAFTLSGSVAFKEGGGMKMSGTWRAPFQGSPIIVSGTFSARK